MGVHNLMSSEIVIPSNQILKKPLPLPYVREEISDKELLDFINNSTSGNQSIIIFGANWCPDCRILEGTLLLPTVKKFMDKNFSIRHIDLGKYDINMHLLELLGVPKEEGIPRVVIFGEKKNILNLDSTDKWRSARQNKSQEIFDYFQSYASKNDT